MTTTNTEQQGAEEQTQQPSYEQNADVSLALRILTDVVNQQGRRIDDQGRKSDENYRALDAKIDEQGRKSDENYRALDAKVDQNYRTLDAKIDEQGRKSDENYRALNNRIDKLVQLIVWVAISIGGIAITGVILMVVQLFIG